MTIEQAFYQELRQRGYWDRVDMMPARDHGYAPALAWSNPNVTADPDTMFKLVWILSSSTRCQRLSPIDVRILDRTATELAEEGHLLPATKSYVKYLWEQVYNLEFSHQLATGECF
ncbi:MAG: hypothetical protein AB4352_16470 [Hormoscilla sp.]